MNTAPAPGSIKLIFFTTEVHAYIYFTAAEEPCFLYFKENQLQLGLLKNMNIQA